MAHLRAVDNRTRFLDIAQLGQRKGVADDVLGDILDTLDVSRLEPHLIMDTEPRVVPPGEDLFIKVSSRQPSSLSIFKTEARKSPARGRISTLGITKNIHSR
jgi:hypothetical protein